MAKATTCKDAIKALEAEKGVVAAEQEKVRIARDASSVSLSLSPSVSLRARTSPGVLKDRRSPRERGRMGNSVTRPARLKSSSRGASE